MLIRLFQPRCLQSSNSIPLIRPQIHRMPAVQGLQLKRKSSITQLPHLLESDPRRPPVHVCRGVTERNVPSAKIVMPDHSYETFPSAVSLQKSTWTFAAA